MQWGSDVGRKVQRKHIQQAFKCVDECVLAAETQTCLH